MGRLSGFVIFALLPSLLLAEHAPKFSELQIPAEPRPQQEPSSDEAAARSGSPKGPQYFGVKGRRPPTTSSTTTTTPEPTTTSIPDPSPFNDIQYQQPQEQQQQHQELLTQRRQQQHQQQQELFQRKPSQQQQQQELVQRKPEQQQYQQQQQQQELLQRKPEQQQYQQQQQEIVQRKPEQQQHHQQQQQELFQRKPEQQQYQQQQQEIVQRKPEQQQQQYQQQQQQELVQRKPEQQQQYQQQQQQELVQRKPEQQQQQQYQQQQDHQQEQYPQLFELSQQEKEEQIKRTDEDLTRHLRDALDQLKIKMRSGMPEADFEVLDPLRLEDMNLKPIVAGEEFDVKMRKLSLTGLSGYEVTQLESQLSESRVKLGLYYPKLHANCLFNANGTLYDIFKLTGKGNATLIFKEVHARTVIYLSKENGTLQAVSADQPFVDFSSAEIYFKDDSIKGAEPVKADSVAAHLGPLYFWVLTANAVEKIDYPLALHLNNALRQFPLPPSLQGMLFRQRYLRVHVPNSPIPYSYVSPELTMQKQ